MAVSVSAADATTKPAAAPKPVATSRPATPAESTTAPTTLPATDTLTNVVDPLDTAGQKLTFLKTSGKTGELDAKTFEADRKAGGGLVMAFEKWETAVLFDKNKNGTLDWFEFDAYRQAMRKAVLAACDKNKDNKLTGDERTDALKRLAEGKLVIKPDPEAERTGPTPPTIFVSTEETRKALLERNEEVHKRAEELGGRMMDMNKQMEELKNRRDKLTKEEYEKERLALAAAHGVLLKEYDEVMEKENRERLMQFDRNANGVLDEDEMAEFLAEVRLADMERGSWRDLPPAAKEMFMRLCDDNGDGRFDEAEMRTAVAMLPELQKSHALLGPNFDEIEKIADAAQREKLYDEWAAVQAGVSKFLQQRADPDGDGKDMDKKMAALSEKLSAGLFRHLNRLAEQALADNGGKAGPATRAAMIKAFDDDLRARIKKFDANNNGQLDPDENLKLSIDLFEEFLKEE